MTINKVLMINVSNMIDFPVFPYAFIQVPAIARSRDVEVVCKDFLGIPRVEWGEALSQLVALHNPKMILITLRNTDSLNLKQYLDAKASGEVEKAYLPIEQTKELISLIRNSTNIAIAIGGFGFSVMPEALMDYLKPDFGIAGEPDGFFEQIDDIFEGRLENVSNLLYFQDDRLVVNRIVDYPPFDQPEYTSQNISEMQAFYQQFPSPGFLGAPIEVIRGCKYRCVFCSEPLVKGYGVRYRDPAVVLNDIETLVSHGITRLYFISSELNPDGNDYIIALADEIDAFNQQQTDERKVTWHGANYLLNFNADEYERLFRSGMTEGWFDITALDDANARAMRTPYRNKHVVKNLKIYADFMRKRYEQTPKVVEEEDFSLGWTLFMGNPATTMKTLRNTIRVANQAGLSQAFTNCSLSTNIRVFDYEDPNAEILNVSRSFNAELEEVDYMQIYPSFAFPPALIQAIGTEKEIESLFSYIGQTLLSTGYQRTRDWNSFLQNHTTTQEINDWITKMMNGWGIDFPGQIKDFSKQQTPGKLDALFDTPEDQLNPQYQKLSKTISIWLLASCVEFMPTFWEMFGFQSNWEMLKRMTPYEIAVEVYKKWETEKALNDTLNKFTDELKTDWQKRYLEFCLRAFLFRSNILIAPEFKQLFIADQ